MIAILAQSPLSLWGVEPVGLYCVLQSCATAHQRVAALAGLFDVGTAKIMEVTPIRGYFLRPSVVGLCPRAAGIGLGSRLELSRSVQAVTVRARLISWASRKGFSVWLTEAISMDVTTNVPLLHWRNRDDRSFGYYTDCVGETRDRDIGCPKRSSRSSVDSAPLQLSTDCV